MIVEVCRGADGLCTMPVHRLVSLGKAVMLYPKDVLRPQKGASSLFGDRRELRKMLTPLVGKNQHDIQAGDRGENYMGTVFFSVISCAGMHC